METNTVKNLIDWFKAARPNERGGRWQSAHWKWRKPYTPSRVVKRVPPPLAINARPIAPPCLSKEEWVAFAGWYQVISPVKAEADPVAICQLIRFDGEDAECRVKLPKFDLPSVSMPARVLRAHNLKEGDRFHWIMREGERISVSDIDPDVPRAPARPQLSDAEKAELLELLEDSRKRESEGGVWEEFTGDGR